MKRFVLFISVLLSAGSLMAQSTIETVYLKNGGLVKGEIIEQVPGQSLKVKTKDGNIFVYQMDEVERITKEADTSLQASAHRGLDFSIDLGYNINTKGGGGSLAAELELGKRFSKSFYWGIGGGAYIPTGDGDPIIPITTDFKAFMPMSNSRITPFVGLKAGYVLNTASDQTVDSGNSRTKVKMPDYIMVQIMPGVQFPLSGSVDFNFGAGYTHFIPASGGDGFGAIAIRAGFGFHRSLTAGKHEKKPLLGSASNALQLTVEAGGFPLGSGDYFGYGGGDIVLSYKLTPTLMFGVGAGYNLFDCGAVWQSGDVSYEDFEGNFIRAFVRGQYRLTDRRFSPFVSCDLGFRFLDNAGIFSEEGDCSTKRLYVAPAVGLSVRSSRNSYIDLKVGYDMSSKFSATINDRKYESAPQSCPFIQLGFTRTFAK